MSTYNFVQRIPSIWCIFKIGFIAALSSLLCVLNSASALAQGLPSTTSAQSTTTASTPYVRENIYTFIQTPQKLKALQNGIAGMKSRPKTDPTSWLYQANIHGTNDVPALDLWTTCEHGSYFFLSWHRMYLYYFERILRAAAAQADPTLPTLNLPYWNYSDVIAQRVLPQPFRIPNTTSNPLYESNRANTINQGQPLSTTVVSYTQALSSSNFIGTVAQNGFGGGKVTGPTHSGGLTGLLEDQPHNQVHVAIGGYMSRVNFAARDPIFWLHHANIDRLWESWIKKGNTNPTSDQLFMKTSFSFFNEKGAKVSLTGAQILDTVNQLNYRYDQLSPSGVAVRASASIPESQLIEVGETPVTQAIQELSTATQKRAIAPPVSRTVINIENVQYDPSNVVPYRIFLNLPPGVTPNPDSPYYAGTIALFAFPQGATYSVDVTDVVSKLKSANLLKDEKLIVTVIPPEPEEFLTSAQVEKLSLIPSIQNLTLKQAMRQSPDISTPKIRFSRITTSNLSN